MDDIFSDPKDDAEKEGDSNIEWKKSGIDKHERADFEDQRQGGQPVQCRQGKRPESQKQGQNAA